MVESVMNLLNDLILITEVGNIVVRVQKWLEKCPGIFFYLVTGHLSLVTGNWSLITSHWSLVTSHWLLVTFHWSLVTGYW